MTAIKVQDSLFTAIPEGLELRDPETYLTLYSLCVGFVHEQYEDRPEEGRPKITFQRIDTLITVDPKEVDDFPMTHDCDNCREGFNKARQYLLDNPGTGIGLANIFYEEHHPEASS